MKKFIQKYKYHLWILLALVVVALISGRVAFPNEEAGTPVASPLTPVTDTTEVTQTSTSTPSTKDVVEEKIKEEKNYEIKLQVNGREYFFRTANELNLENAMNFIARDTDFTFSGKKFGGDLGLFVEEINGVKNNSDKYWVYYINDTKAQVGISNYIIQPNDLIEWKYEKEI